MIYFLVYSVLLFSILFPLPVTVFLYVTFTMHLNGSNLGPCHCLLDCGNGRRGEGKIIQSSY